VPNVVADPSDLNYMSVAHRDGTPPGADIQILDISMMELRSHLVPTNSERGRVFPCFLFYFFSRAVVSYVSLLARSGGLYINMLPSATQM
jgi:hypothetical protein